MSVLKEMFSENSDDNYENAKEHTLLAKGQYESKSDTILEGYKVFRKKYTYARLAFRLGLVALAILSSVLSIVANFNAEEQDYVPYFLIIVAVFIGVYFINVHTSNMKKLKESLVHLEGEEYCAEIYNDSIKITSLSVVLETEPAQETDISEEKSETAEKNDDEKNTEQDAEDIENSEEGEPVPATIIHLDQSIVDILDKDDMFIVVVKKSYVFVIPKSAFTEDEVKAVEDKFRSILGVRYKTV